MLLLTPCATLQTSAGVYEAVQHPESKPETQFRSGSTLRAVKKGEQLLINYGGTMRFPCLVCDAVNVDE